MVPSSWVMASLTAWMLSPSCSMVSSVSASAEAAMAVATTSTAYTAYRKHMTMTPTKGGMSFTRSATTGCTMRMTTSVPTPHSRQNSRQI